MTLLRGWAMEFDQGRAALLEFEGRTSCGAEPVPGPLGHEGLMPDRRDHGVVRSAPQRLLEENPGAGAQRVVLLGGDTRPVVSEDLGGLLGAEQGRGEYQVGGHQGRESARRLLELGDSLLGQRAEVIGHSRGVAIKGDGMTNQ